MMHLMIMANLFEIEDHSRPLNYAIKLAKLSVSKITSLSSQLVYLRKEHASAYGYANRHLQDESMNFSFSPSVWSSPHILKRVSK